jgi:hypothetical protein
MTGLGRLSHDGLAEEAAQRHDLADVVPAVVTGVEEHLADGLVGRCVDRRLIVDA